MSKRKLNKQQLQRIHIRKQTRQEKLLNSEELGDIEQGLVISHFGRELDVESLAPPHNVYRCFARSTANAIACGDTVIWRKNKANDQGVIVQVLERRSKIERPSQHKGLKLIAANIDNIFIVVAHQPHPHRNLIDRYLVAAESAGLNAHIIFNKVDCIADETFFSQFDIYRTLNYPCIKVSAHKGDGIKLLESLLSGANNIFVGQSGVGKSSLINTLQDERATIQSLSTTHASGKHTTTTARLYHLRCGGNIIDSPGIREFGLWHLTAEDISHGFKEFANYLGCCQFRDCTHLHESGCAIIQAAQAGAIDSKRLHSFQQIITSPTHHQ